MLSADFIDILRCPETQQKVALATNEQISKVNQLITEGNCRNRDGAPISEIIDSGLVREDAKIIYPVRKDIPIMLVGEGIALV